MSRSRAEAQSLIREGKVSVGGVANPKPATSVDQQTPISIDESLRRWVSRGALKLLAALEEFGIDVGGRDAIDVGASTGGFTEVLLDRGAAAVVALDVGHGQLDPNLCDDPRVVVMESTDIRSLESFDLPFKPSVVVCDVSFISLCLVAPSLAQAASRDADFVLLVKPQFESGADALNRRGVVTNPETRRRAVTEVMSCLVEAGLFPQAIRESPLKGAKGNVEYLLWLRMDRQQADVEVPT